jgi:hypothetical protein
MVHGCISSKPLCLVAVIGHALLLQQTSGHILVYCDMITKSEGSERAARMVTVFLVFPSSFTSSSYLYIPP